MWKRCTLTTEAGGLFARRARLSWTMKKLIIILTSSYCILGVAGNLNPSVDKCCPQGQVISDLEPSIGTPCSFAGYHHQQIYQFQRQGAHEAFWACSESENVTMKRLEYVTEPIRANEACIEIIYEEEEDVPTVFRCTSNGLDDEAPGIKSFAVPRLPKLRMCCGIYQVYDVEKRDCVFKKDGPNVPMNFEFLNGSMEFVSVIRGAPPCKSAVLDYVVNTARDLRVHDDGRLEVVLATKDGPVTIIADENNTCLDPGTSGTPGLIVVRACSEEKFCDRNPCVRKCCPEDQAMIDEACSFIPSGVPAGYFHDILHNVSVKHGLERKMDPLENSDYGMLIGGPCEYPSVPDPDERWHITPLGTIDVADDKIYSHDQYCVEMFFSDLSLEENIYPLLCPENPES